MKLLIPIFVLILAYFTPAQHEQKTLLQFKYKSPEKITINDISRDGFVILGKCSEKSCQYYLINSNNPKDKKLIFPNEEGSHQYIKFAGNQDYIILISNPGKKFFAKIYNRKNNSYFTIERPDGNIGSVSLFDKEHILYQFRKFNNIQKTYKYSMIDSSSKFLIYGASDKISPNGKWFFVKNGDEERNLSLEKFRAEKIDKKEYNYQLSLISQNHLEHCIYNFEGKQILRLNEFKNQINEMNWSPNSKKIVLTEIGDLGFFIIYFSETDDSLKVTNIYHFKGLPSGKGVYASSQNPVWSVDGKSILFINSIEDGHNILSSEFWILEDPNHNYYKIKAGIKGHIFTATLTNKNNILFADDDYKDSIVRVNEIFINHDLIGK